MHTLVEQPALLVMLSMVSIAAASDWKTGLIPNAVIALGAGLGVLVQLLAVVVFEASFAASLLRMTLGFVVCTILPLTLWLLGALGGGDLKLFAAIGLCVGPGMGLDIQLWSHVLALLVLPLYFLRHGGVRAALPGCLRALRGAFRPRAVREPAAPVPGLAFRFAPAILAACVLVTLLHGVCP
jgi:prepilin peptidase CpaA